MSRPGYSTSAVVQVQSGAPAKLLVGTDLLSRLGYFFVQASEDDHDLDMLATESENTLGGQSIQQQDGSNKERCDDAAIIESDAADNLTQSKFTFKKDTSVEEGSTICATETVCLVQATRIPARHKKMVRVKLSEDNDCYEGILTMFELDIDGVVETQQLMALSSLICLDHLTLVLENHGCEPIYLQSGQILGHIENVLVCLPEEVQDSGNDASPPAVNTLFAKTTAAQCERAAPTTETTEPAKQERLVKLKEALTIYQSNLSSDQIASLVQLIEEYSDIFALDATELGCTNLVTHSIDTGNSPPIRQPARRVPFALHSKMEQLVEDMLDQGVIQHSSSPWASPVVLVKKKDGSHRFCVDYRRLNSVTKMDVFPLPRVDDTLDMLSQTQFFSTLDLAAGYWQVRKDRASQEKTAFNTHSGHYEFCVMPFGLCNGLATFQWLMESVLVGLLRKCCMVYLDDVLIIGKNFAEHLTNMRKVFDRFRLANLKLKPTKCFLAGTEVTYLGYMISRTGISADPQKVEAVQNFPPPDDLTSLRSFLGLASYYRRFVPGFSTIAGPLYLLLQKNTIFLWGQTQQESFDHLKQLLTCAPVLAFPDFDQEFILETDASGKGLGAILAQKQPDGFTRPIAYASRTLQQHERKYSATELEALGIVWSVKHFRHYLYGHRCIVYTDHEPLRSLLNTPHPSGKLARWGLALQEVDLVLHYPHGRTNKAADSLSRFPLRQSYKHEKCSTKSQTPKHESQEGEDNMTNQLESNIMIDKTMVDQLKGNTQDSLTCEAEFHRLAEIDHLVDTYRVSPVVTAASEPQDCTKSGEGINTSKDFLIAAVVSEPQDGAKSGEGIKDRQREDAEIKMIIDFQENNILPDDDRKARELLLSRMQYQLMDGILYYVANDKTLWLIPPTADRKQLFEEVHCGPFGAHLREAKVHGELYKHYWWPKMRSDIRNWCNGCLVCATRQPSRAVHAPLNSIPVEGPFHRVGVDVIQFPKSQSGNQYAVVFTDYLTKWPEVFATKDQTALTIAELFVEEIVCRHGVPGQLLSDRGAAFLSRLLKEICSLLGVKKINTTAYHPQTNGLTERFNRTLTDMLAKRVEKNGKDWDTHLPFVLFAYRASTQESTKESPFYLMYGRDPRLPTALEMDNMSCEEMDVDSYKREVSTKLSEAWELAKNNNKKAE